LAADEAGFSRIAHGQYVIFIALRREPSFKRQKVSIKVFKNYSKRRKINLKERKGATAVVKELSQYVFGSKSRNYKVNFTMFIKTIKAVRNSCVLTM
jgi:hypothetical protein